MILNVQNLTKRYGENTVVDRLSLSVAEGEIFGLLGPNGTGKTTLINCIQSLLKYDSGKIEIQGKPMHPTAYDLKRQIGVVGQNVAVFDELNVYDNISFLLACTVSKVPRLFTPLTTWKRLNKFAAALPLWIWVKSSPSIRRKR